VQRGREAAAAFHALAARPGADLSDAFAAVLAARLDCAPAALVSPDLARRLVASGLPPAVSQPAARMLEALVGARYGGVRPEPEAAASLVRSIESL
jgi:hypothetical protein